MTVFVLVFGNAAGAQSTDHSNDVAMRAMRDELARSVEQLRLDTLPKAYFIAYRMTESEGTGIAARLGSLLGTFDRSKTRLAFVEVRVGDYAFDNTNYFGAGFMPTAFVGYAPMPIDDDYLEIRRQLWIATDRAYKQAVEALSQKRAALQARMPTDSAPDFSREQPNSAVDERAPAPFDRAAADALVRSLSAIFRSMPDIYNSRVSLTSGWLLTRYVNSEGTSFTRATPRASVSVTANTQASDGMPLADSYEVSAPSQSQLPSRDSLTAATRALATNLVQLRQTTLAEAYEGPVLFEGRAAAELFNMIVAPRLIGMRRPIVPQALERMVAGSDDGQEMLGSPVLPRFMSVVDDPTLRVMDGMPLESYRVDDDGVPARATRVVDHGVLKTLLMARVPVPGIEHSTGNRRGMGATPSTLVVSADSVLSQEELKRALIARATSQGLAYGIIVRRISRATGAGGGDGGVVFMSGGMGDVMSGEGPRMQSLAAYRVYPDGREEMIRAPEISGITLQTFRNIVAVSDKRTVATATFSGRGTPFTGGGGGGPVSYVMPSLLFGNVTLRRPRGGNPRLPVVPPPPAP